MLNDLLRILVPFCLSFKAEPVAVMHRVATKLSAMALRPARDTSLTVTWMMKDATTRPP